MESMKGFVTFEDKKYPFSFSGERLALYPDEFSSQSLQEFFAPFERGNTIKDIELNGITANRKGEDRSDPGRNRSVRVFR